MKKLLCVVTLYSLVISLCACGGMSVSDKMYNEISDYVTGNMDSFSPAEENELYDYKTTGLSIDGVYFGKPNSGTDWCFIKRISDNWYYYELHWA